MMARISIRLRLTLWYSAVLLLGLVLFSAATWLMLEKRLMAGVDDRLAQRIQGLQTLVKIEAGEDVAEELREFARSAPEGALMQARDNAGTDVLPANPVFTSVDWQPGHRKIERGGKRYRMIVTRIAPYNVIAASSLDDVEAILRELRNLLLWLIPVDFAAACLGGYWISRRALAPVDRMTRAAKSISVQDLSQRLEVPETGDELQHLADTWNDFLERLEKSVTRVQQFTADASHELRTPVSLIHATAELALRRERTPGSYREALQQILKEAESMAALTESLLTLARSDQNAIEMPMAAIDLSRVAGEVVRGIEAVCESRGVQLYADTGERALFAAANEQGIRRLLAILIDNALKHTPAGGIVTVSVVPLPNRDIRLQVRDSGTGIPDDALPHVFERFYRADPSHEGPGAGLGLAIAQAIAQAHGSEIVVESIEGAGASFSLTLKNEDTNDRGIAVRDGVRSRQED